MVRLDCKGVIEQVKSIDMDMAHAMQYAHEHNDSIIAELLRRAEKKLDSLREYLDAYKVIDAHHNADK